LIHGSLQITEEAMVMIQIDEPKRQVYIKLATVQHMLELIRKTGGKVEYIHVDGTKPHIKIDVAGKGTKAILIENPPPEVPNKVLKVVLVPYGTIVAIRSEVRSKIDRYAVANGVRIVKMTANKNIPSHIQIAGHRVLLTYEDWP
jgi:Ser-tRNA(Ala) deacylase AlaX